jgi:AcrR family transcriptional regulator
VSLALMFPLKKEPAARRSPDRKFKMSTTSPSHSVRALPESGVSDIRVRLRESLLQLILKRSWQRIRVRDICVRAGVARSTFYAHFAHKEDLLLSGYDDLKRVLAAGINQKGTFGFLPGLIRHVAENRHMFQQLVRAGAGHLPTAHFRMFLLELVHEDLFGKGRRNSVEQLRAHYIAGALSDVLLWWAQEEPHISAAKFCRSCLRLSRRLVEESR